MHGAVAGKLAVVSADKSVVPPFALHKVVAVGQLRPALGAVQKPGQTVWGVLRLGGAAFGFSKPLDVVPRFLVDDGGDCSLKDILFLCRGLAGAFGLVVLAYGLSQHLAPHVFRAAENVADSGR